MATTANRLYPYPLSSASVFPHTDIQALATALDTDVQALYFPSWVTYGSAQGLTWTGSIANPTLGNGTLEGRYQLQGTKRIRFQILLTYGSTSTAGNGFWIFSLPFAADTDSTKFALGVSHMDDISAQGRPGGTRFNSSTQLIMDNSGGAVSGGTPAAPASGDKYRLDITYDRV
jgi:hypothetical protein